MTRFSTLLLAGVSLLPVAVQAQTLPPIDVNAASAASAPPEGAPEHAPALGGVSLPAPDIAARAAAAGDAAALLAQIAGVSVATNGGASGFPTIHGFADDRLRIKVDGVDTVASCPNHMNPALSYIAPAQVASVKVWTGVAPVSVGGDSIGGAAAVASRPPLFASAASGQALAVKDAAPGLLVAGSVGGFFRSNGAGLGVNGSATVATERYSLSYDGAFAQSDNIRAGGAFRGKNYVNTATPALPASEVGSTAYQTQSHLATLAYQNDGHLLDLKLNYQHVPYQLYPNQRMDMLDNQETGINLHYFGKFAWGGLDARVYYQHVAHYMDFGQNKLKTYGAITGSNGVVYPVAGMPMNTRSDTIGATGKADVALSAIDALRIGYDLQFYRLNDWWPPSPNCGVGVCAGGMAPYTFQNINNGQRDRYAAFAEWERAWSPEVTSLLGARYERVETNTGTVQGYVTSTTPLATAMQKMMYANSSVGTLAAFNAMDRARGFNNVDLSALIRYAPNANIDAELGLGQAMRAPGLYELYPWSTASMAAVMNNFVGDGNGYVGNPNLKAEQAQKISLALGWHDGDRAREIRVTPYYSRVRNYIDAVQFTQNAMTGVITPKTTLTTNQFVLLQYANKEAELYGFDLSAKTPVASTAYGDFGLTGMMSYTHGRDLSLRTGLYNIMPLNGKVGLTHRLGRWGGAAEFVAVADKTDVSAQRNEIRTPGYGLINLRGAYDWDKVHFTFGVENLLNRLYYLPLGGAYVGEGKTMSINGVSYGVAVPGPGRAVYAGMRMDF